MDWRVCEGKHGLMLRGRAFHHLRCNPYDTTRRKPANIILDHWAPSRNDPAPVTLPVNTPGQTHKGTACRCGFRHSLVHPGVVSGSQRGWREARTGGDRAARTGR